MPDVNATKSTRIGTGTTSKTIGSRYMRHDTEKAVLESLKVVIPIRSMPLALACHGSQKSFVDVMRTVFRIFSSCYYISVGCKAFKM